MTNDELNSTLSTISGFWPRTGKQLEESSMTLGLWRKRLRPYVGEVVESAIEQYVMAHKGEPTLEDLLTAIEARIAHRQKNDDFHGTPNPETVDETDEAVSRVTSPDDIAWALLHVRIHEKGWARPNANARQAMAAAYRQFALEHPSMAALAHLHAAGCEEEAQMLARGEIREPAELPVTTPATAVSEGDLPF